MMPRGIDPTASLADVAGGEIEVVEEHLDSKETISSPAATGGAGERFEQRVDAYALALLLVRSTAPVLLDSSVLEVHLQTEHLGWRTDDLLIVGQVHPGLTRKLAIQAKRTFTIAVADEDCVQTIRGMWDDFIAGDRFDPETDRLAVATLHGSTTLLGSFASLLDCARASMNAEDFRWRVGLKGYLSKKAKTQNEALLTILRAHVTEGLDEDMYWRFLRILCVLSLDLGTETSHTEALVLALLSHVSQGVGDPAATARATWNALLDVASEGRTAAASYRRDGLPAELLERHQVVSASDDRALLDLIDHGKTVRKSIRTTIGPGYVLDRSAHASSLLEQMEDHRVIVASGTAGSGKSALMKILLDRVELERPVLAFQAVEFATAHINETLARTQTALNAQALVSVLAAHDKTTILIDGVERLLEHSVRDAFAHLLQVVAGTPSLRLLLTCRDYSLETVRSALLTPAGLAHGVFEVGAVSDEELEALIAGVPILSPALHDPHIRSFLRTPYLLDMASRLQWSEATLPQNVRTFREKCWRELVRNEAFSGAGMPRRREAAFVDVARRRATELRPFVRSETQDMEALDALREASLLQCSPESDRFFAPAHDVLEDWAILNWLDDVALTSDDRAAALSQAVGGLPAMRRGLRRWLAERLETDVGTTRELVVTVSERPDLPQHFRDDCVVAAMLSDSASEFLSGCRERIAAGDTSLLRQVVHLLRVACKAAPPWLPEGGLPSAFLVPTGPGWVPALELVASILPLASINDSLLVLGLVEDWARQITIATESPPGADAAGRIISELLPLFDGYGFDSPRKRALEVLLKIPRHAPAFRELADRVFADDRDDRTARDFADLAVSTLSSAYVCRDFPDVMINLLRARLMMTEADLEHYSWSSLEVSECFGIRERGVSDYFPASALQGPFRALLWHHPQKAVAFIVQLLNHSGDWYGLRRWPGNDLEPAARIKVEVPGVGSVEQWMNGRMFVLYRGMSVGPYALQSALMALESWLLELAALNGINLEGWLLYVLRHSNNAMATGVIASVCIAHPERAGRAALALLSSRELIDCDRQRFAAEHSTSIELFPSLNPSHAVYEAERRKANVLPHRREDLESLAVRLQLTDLRDAVWALIDQHRAALRDEQDEDALVWRLALHRMDVRGYREAAPPSNAELEGEEERRVYFAPGNIEPEVQSLVDTSRERMTVLNRHLRLLNASHALWDNKNSAGAAEWHALLVEARSIDSEIEAPEPYAAGGPGIVAAVCIRDHLADLTTEELAWCAGRVVAELSQEQLHEVYRHSRMFGADRAAAAVVTLLVAEASASLHVDALDLLVRAFTHEIDEVVEYAYAGAGAFLRDDHRNLILRCAAAAVREAQVSEAERIAERKRHGVRSAVQGGASERVKAQARPAVAAHPRTRAAVAASPPRSSAAAAFRSCSMPPGGIVV